MLVLLALAPTRTTSLSSSRVMRVTHEDFGNLHDERAFPNYDDERVDLFVVLFIAGWSAPMQALAHEYDEASVVLNRVAGTAVAVPSRAHRWAKDAGDGQTHRSGSTERVVVSPRVILQRVDVEDTGAAPLLRRFGIVAHPALLFFWTDGDGTGKTASELVEFSELMAWAGADGTLRADEIVKLVVSIHDHSSRPASHAPAPPPPR